LQKPVPKGPGPLERIVVLGQQRITGQRLNTGTSRSARGLEAAGWHRISEGQFRRLPANDQTPAFGPHRRQPGVGRREARRPTDNRTTVERANVVSPPKRLDTGQQRPVPRRESLWPQPSTIQPRFGFAGELDEVAPPPSGRGRTAVASQRRPFGHET